MAARKYKPLGGGAPQNRQTPPASAQGRRPAGRPPADGGGGGGGGGRGGIGGGFKPGQKPIGDPFPGAGPGKFGFIPGGSENEPGYDWLGKGGEYWSPTRLSVGPAGSNLLGWLMGGRAGAGNLGDWTGIGPALDPTGRGDPMGATAKALQDWYRTGGVVDPTQELAKGRFASNALWDQQAGKQQTFADWFDIGNLGGATGPLTQRLMGGGAADWGYKGQQGALETQPFKGFQFIQQALAQNPNLDPEAERRSADRYIQDMGGINTLGTAGGISKLLQSAMNRENTYGKARHTADELARDTSRLQNDYESALMSNIDTESQRTLASQLPEVQAQMAAAGLDRSGASRGAATQVLNDILGQAMRDKQSLLGQFAETGRGIQANALAQGHGAVQAALEGSAGRQGQAILGGAQGMLGALEGDAARQAQSILAAQQQGGQAFQREHERYMSDTDAYLRAIMGSETSRLQGLQGQGAMQSDAQDQFMRLFGMQEQSYGSALERMLGLAEQNRAIQQQRLAGQLQAGMMPMELMLRLATGTSAPVFQPQQTANPWANLGPDLVGSVAGGALGGLFQSQAPSALQWAMGNNPAMYGGR